MYETEETGLSPIEQVRRAAILGGGLRPGTLDPARSAMPADMAPPSVGAPAESPVLPHFDPQTGPLDVQTPPVAPGPAMLNPNDPKYASLAPHGMKKAGLVAASLVGGPITDLAQRSLFAPEIAYGKDVAAQKQQADVQESQSKVGLEGAQGEEARQRGNTLQLNAGDVMVTRTNPDGTTVSVPIPRKDAAKYYGTQDTNQTKRDTTYDTNDTKERMNSDRIAAASGKLSPAQEDQHYERIKAMHTLGQQVDPADDAWAGAYEKRKTLTPFASAAAQAPTRADSRSDRSYQFNSGKLSKLRTPIDQRAQRISDLTSNVNFRTPQADSLLAPEILSVVAGGQGSGLRMNEAEISRITGGATKWTALKTELNKWSLDPRKAQFTEEQRNQMRQIVQAIQTKVAAKQKILDDAEQALSETDDVKEHRKISADAEKKLSAIDGGNAPAAVSNVAPAATGKPKTAAEYLRKFNGGK